MLRRNHPGSGRLALACGGLGDFDPARVKAIAAAMPSPVDLVHQSARARLYLDREPIRWSGAAQEAGLAWSEHGWMGDARPTSRLQAARDFAASGIVVGSRSVAVHASGLGLQPVYVQREGTATYFCSRLNPLADASPDLLAIDWAAWSAIFEFGCPLGVRTGFEGIERLEPGGRVEHPEPGADGTLAADPWSWAEFGSERPADSAGDLLEALREQVTAVPTRRGRVIVPLSGGWDSRLLAFALKDSGRQVRSLTVNTDAGHEVEESLATPVARSLGIKHRLVKIRNVDYWDHWRAAAALEEHQSLIHLPLQALAATIPPTRDPIFDGFAGDVLIKGFWVDGRILGAPTWHRATRMLWRRFRLNRGGLRMFSEHHAHAIRHSARAQFMSEASRFDGHEAAATLFVSWTRSRRLIAPSPLDLLGARGPVAIPFATDAVAKAALAVPPAEKLDGAFYRRVLERADPRLVAWPSTNDPDSAARNLQRHRQRSTLSKRAVEGYLELLRSHPLRSSFSGAFDHQVESGKIRQVLRHQQGVMALDALCRFADWHARHASSLKAFEPADVKQL